MRLLITGGCGFIGTNFIRHLHRTHPDWSITNLDALTYAGNRASLADLEEQKNYRLIVGRIEDPQIALTAMAGCDWVVNFAAETHVDRSILEPAPFLQTNFIGVQVLIDAARQIGVKKFLHVSTDEVYGSLNDTDAPCDETAHLAPRSPYAATKAAADLLLLAAHHTFGLPAIIIRPSNNYGPYQFPEKLLPLAITNLFQEQKVPVYGTGKNIRDWVYVEDTCRAIELLLLAGKPGTVYNAGADQGCRNIDLIRLLLRLLGKEEDHIEFVPDRPGHDYRYALNSARLKSLGWQPQVTLEEGLIRTIRWYEENPSWWQPLKRRLQKESRGFWT